LSAILLATSFFVSTARSDEAQDYRSRTIYFAVTDRFHAHDPFNPYVDPDYPSATNSVNCFTGNCQTEVEYRSFWGGDIAGLIQKLEYLKDMGIGAVWLTPLFQGVRDYGPGIGYGTDYHGYWVDSTQTFSIFNWRCASINLLVVTPKNRRRESVPKISPNS
jgi:hypothetical protein